MADRTISGKDMLLYRGNRDGGHVATVPVSAGGTGYTTAPAVTFHGGGGGGAAATAVVADGAVTAVNITAPGFYLTAPFVTFTGGGGSGAAANTTLTEETYDLVACLTDNNITQGSSTTTTETKCGTVTSAGAKTSSVTFSFVPVFDPSATKVPIEVLQEDYDSQIATTLWRITTPSMITKDPIFSFVGGITELNFAAPVSGDFSGTGTIQPSAEGIVLEIVP
jgi:hypothetical protein